jgi:hypothetical protein
MAKGNGLKIYPIIFGGGIKFDGLPPGLRYTLSSTNCTHLPQQQQKHAVVKQLLQSMKRALQESVTSGSTTVAPEDLSHSVGTDVFARALGFGQ